MKLDFDSRIIIGICALLLADLALSCYQVNTIRYREKVGLDFIECRCKLQRHNGCCLHFRCFVSFLQLLFKKSFPKGDMGQISFAISVIYLLSFVVYFPVPIILHETGVEKYNMTDLPYHYLIGASSCVTGTVTFPSKFKSKGFFYLEIHLTTLHWSKHNDLRIRTGRCWWFLHGPEWSSNNGLKYWCV